MSFRADQSMVLKGYDSRESVKAYVYTWETRGLYEYVYLPLLAFLFCFSIYVSIAEIHKFPRGLVALFVVLASGYLLLIVALVCFHLGTIVVGDKEIKIIRRSGQLTIPWDEVEQVYYTIHPGNIIADPYFTLCLMSKNKLIMIERGIDRREELFDTIREKTSGRPVRDISFSELVKILFRYLK